MLLWDALDSLHRPQEQRGGSVIPSFVELAEERCRLFVVCIPDTILIPSWKDP